MPQTTNHLGQPVGEPVPNWIPATRPAREAIKGRFCRVEPLNVDRHARELFEANALDTEGRNWTYLAYGPFEEFGDYNAWVSRSVRSEDPLFFAIIDEFTGRAVGVASYLRFDPPNGVIEVGSLNFSPLLQKTPAATEAMYLMMDHAFHLGYRRYEWKCDSLNAPSRRAAQRLGFSFEGIFRQAVIYKGRSRDTAWYAIIDSDWPALRAAYCRWLDPKNFDDARRQITSLTELTARLLTKKG